MKAMASFHLKSKATYHARSISLPARSHPLTARVEEQLYHLKSSGSTSTPSSIIQSLDGLKELLDRVNDSLHMSLSHQVLAHERSDRCVNEVLDGSLMVLDVCSNTRDVLLKIRESAKDLQSDLRRTRGQEHGVENKIALYMASRMQESKAIKKYLGDLKRTTNKRLLSTLLDKDGNFVAVIRMLREVEFTSLSILESILTFTCSSRSKSKSSGWCLISKLIQTKGLAYHGDGDDTSEMEKVDAALSNLLSHKAGKDIEEVQQLLKELELSIKGIEIGLELVYKSSIKSRVSLLNILSQ